MKIYTSRGMTKGTSGDRIIRLLNGASPWEKNRRSKWLNINSQRQLHALFTEIFRGLIDRWIESGKDGGGIETPARRNLCRSGRPASLTEAHLELLGWEGPPERFTLREMLLAWYERNPPQIDIQRDGERTIVFGLPGRELNEDYAAETAIYCLDEVLSSPDARRIGRCDNPECRSYYTRARARKLEIKRGTYCGNCAGVASKIRTNASRDRLKLQRIDLAADLWDKFKPSLRWRKAEWVATEMNKGLPRPRKIMAKWVTQNQEAIEAEVERRKKHAKG